LHLEDIRFMQKENNRPLKKIMVIVAVITHVIKYKYDMRG